MGNAGWLSPGGLGERHLCVVPERHPAAHGVPAVPGEEQLRGGNRLDLIDQHVLVAAGLDDSQRDRAHLVPHRFRELVTDADGPGHHAAGHRGCLGLRQLHQELHCHAKRR